MQKQFVKNIKIVSSFIILIVLVITASILYKNSSIKKSEGTIIECTKIKRNIISSLIFMIESTEYKTIIKVDNNIIVSYDKYTYYLCKDNINNKIDVELLTYKGEPISIKKVLDEDTESN